MDEERNEIVLYKVICINEALKGDEMSPSMLY